MPFYNLRDAGVRTASALACIALLSACGSNPEPVENSIAVADETLNDATNIAAVADSALATNDAAAAEETPAATSAEPIAAAAQKPAAAASEPVETASAGDAANGEKLFVQCRICHAVEPGKNGLGPSLHGVVGRQAAKADGFSFSPAMQNSGIVWNDTALNDYLRSPMKFVPGTKMAFAGMANDTQRADMIAYLKTLK